MIDQDKAASRPMAVAAALTGRSIDDMAFHEQLVVLTGELRALRTPNGRWIFVDAVRLLLRVAGKLLIDIPEGLDDLTQEVRQICETCYVRQQPTIRIGQLDSDLSDAKAILNIGCQPRSGAPCVSVSANGWLCRATSGPASLDGDFSQANPISSLFAASIGVSEVFKRLIEMSDDISPPIENMTFSLFDHSDDPGDIGPTLPSTLEIPNTLLVGGGAIGSGVALLAAQLALRGKLHVVDKQQYADENMGTCVLMERNGWSKRGKAARLAEWISDNGSATASGERDFIADAASRETCQALAPSVVINGLDDVVARHDAQMLWPDIILDGGINNLGAAVVQHRLDNLGKACLRCTFKLPEVDTHAMQADLTGLDIRALIEPGRQLTAEDLESAAPDKRERLRKQMSEGKTICSIVSEAAMARLGVNLDAEFRPSVPFVATAAASLVMAEFAKYLLNPSAAYHQTTVFGSLFLGATSSARINRAADPSCLCVIHRETILSSKVRLRQHLEV
ncbi:MULTISPECIES: ThiF family adenylyltransferase [Dyella]|nr:MULTISPECIES: ThiF family adenylyltransferase [Dyella]